MRVAVSRSSFVPLMSPHARSIHCIHYPLSSLPHELGLLLPHDRSFRSQKVEPLQTSKRYAIGRIERCAREIVINFIKDLNLWVETCTQRNTNLLNFLDRHEVPAVQLGFRSWPCEAFDLGGWDSQREECHWATNLMHCIWLHLIATSIHKLFIVDYCRPRFKAGEWRFEAIWSTFTEATGGQPSWFRGRGRWGEKFRFSMHSSMHSRWNKNIKNGDCDDCDDCDDYLFLIVQMYSCLCHAGKCCRMFIALAAWGAMFLWKSGFEVQPLNEKTALNHGSCFFDPLWFLWGFEHFCKLQLLLSTNVWSGRVLALQLLLLLELAAGATWNHQTKLGKQSIIGNLPCGRDVLPRSVPRYLLLFLSSW